MSNEQLRAAAKLQGVGTITRKKPLATTAELVGFDYYREGYDTIVDYSHLSTIVPINGNKKPTHD